MLSALLGLLALACGSLTDSKSCTLLACGEEGLRVNFRFTEKGAYDFEISFVDTKGLAGTKTNCHVVIPRDPASAPLSGVPCDRTSDAILTADQESVGGITMLSTTLKTVKIKGTRDGVLLGDKTIDVNYTVTPGPNGAECDPKECRSMKTSFP